MLSDLPGWVKSDVDSVREEVAEWKDLTPAELWRLAVLCSRDAMWAVRASGEAEHILAQEDPLPDSSRAVLTRSTGGPCCSAPRYAVATERSARSGFPLRPHGGPRGAARWPATSADAARELVEAARGLVEAARELVEAARELVEAARMCGNAAPPS